MMKQPKRDYTHDQEGLDKIFQDYRDRIAGEKPQKPQKASSMSPKVQRKRMRRVDNLCKNTMKYGPEYKHYSTYSVILQMNDVIEIKFNGSELPGTVSSVKRSIPLSDIQEEIKRMSEYVRRHKNKTDED